MVLLLLAGCRNGPEVVVINGESFVMELAITEEEITRGMSGRDSFPEGGGMLFVFPDADVRRFWMYECIIDIDLIFLDGRGIVTALHRMTVEPLRQPGESEDEYQQRLRLYSSHRPAHFAIELPAGSIDRLGVRVEDRVEMDLERLKAMAR